ncbi:hypothetical protein [Ralstonia pseudosolanacearum]|uniref:hypothetical protein n=1 Tax=Ralstonia pseudosolanacearum TaxID=1310165 RepID=UPI001FF9C2ED|nr:hypothetical protein [Ralstonia pseudosolanacearum]
MSESDSDLIERLAVAVAGHVRQSIPLNVALWDVELIAQYLVRSPQVVRERVVTLPNFPKPIRIPSVQSGGGATTKSLPRWKASEVITWTESYREKVIGRPRATD